MEQLELDPFATTFVLFTGVDSTGHRLKFPMGHDAVRHQLTQQGLTVKRFVSNQRVVAIVPDGTHHIPGRPLTPFITMTHLSQLLMKGTSSVTPTPTGPVTATPDDDSTWPRLLDHVREQLKLTPQASEDSVMAELWDPLWTTFMERIEANQWRFHPFLYRPARAWLTRIVEKLKHAGQLEWVPRIDRVINDTLPTMLRAYEDAMIECFETGGSMVTPSMMYHAPNSPEWIMKPFMIYSQELILAICDRQKGWSEAKRAPLFEKLRTRLQITEKDSGCPEFLAAVSHWQKRARQRMGLSETDGILWIDLPEMIQKTDWKLLVDLEGAKESDLQQLGQMIRSVQYRDKLAEWVWPFFEID
jgi:hypothetical protein